jgi:hypothetical protein
MSEKKIFTKRVFCQGETEPRKKREIFSKKVFYRDKKLVTDRPGYEVEEILAKHVLPGDDYNPTGETAKAAATAVLDLSKRIKDGKRKGGEAKLGRVGPMMAMLKVLRPRSLDELLSMLENEEIAGDLPEHQDLIERGYRIRIRTPSPDQEGDVDREANVLHYMVNDAGKKISFDALRNYISKLKKHTFTGC